MKRTLALIGAVYVPHLVEEAVTGMHDDRLIVAAYGPLSQLEPRHASYLVFQIMLAIAIGMTLAWSRGERGQRVVVALLGLALLAESHHVLRALVTLSYNSGLLTSLPMPFIGALAFARAFDWKMGLKRVDALKSVRA
jgi:Protein of unknown function with HXXEE motif